MRNRLPVDSVEFALPWHTPGDSYRVTRGSGGELYLEVFTIGPAGLEAEGPPIPLTRSELEHIHETLERLAHN